MVKNIIVYFSIFFISCSAVVDPEVVFLSKIKGVWKTGETTVEWFASTIGEPSLTVPKGTSVNVLSDGSFMIGGVPFRFISVDTTGVFVTYGFIHPASSSERYIAVGINRFDNIIFNPTIVLSADQIPTTLQGSIFLEK